MELVWRRCLGLILGLFVLGALILLLGFLSIMGWAPSLMIGVLSIEPGVIMLLGSMMMLPYPWIKLLS
ncbi:hypothetical protein [Ferrimonas pelagia]|uniref:Uncharacterized protein n=1 Tax=Ferrimonas pelagia TaxID=1177826 RepID=A0ABP9F4N5_9GAMM